MKSQIEKLSEYYGQPYTSLTQRPPIEIENATSYWNYAVQLTECMMRVSINHVCVIVIFSVWLLLAELHITALLDANNIHNI